MPKETANFAICMSSLGFLLKNTCKWMIVFEKKEKVEEDCRNNDGNTEIGLFMESFFYVPITLRAYMFDTVYAMFYVVIYVYKWCNITEHLSCLPICYKLLIFLVLCLAVFLYSSYFFSFQ